MYFNGLFLWNLSELIIPWWTSAALQLPFIHFKAAFKGCCYVSFHWLLGFLTELNKVSLVLRLIPAKRWATFFRFPNWFGFSATALNWFGSQQMHHPVPSSKVLLKGQSSVQSSSTGRSIWATIPPPLLLAPIKEWIPFETLLTGPYHFVYAE